MLPQKQRSLFKPSYENYLLKKSNNIYCINKLGFRNLHNVTVHVQDIIQTYRWNTADDCELMLNEQVVTSISATISNLVFYQNRSTQFLVLDMEGSFKSWSQRSKLVHILSTGQDVGRIYNGILVIKNNEIMQVNNGPRYFHIVWSKSEKINMWYHLYVESKKQW